MLILGLNAHHADAAACIIRDGQLVAAAEEERFRRIKHVSGFPEQAVAWCLREAGATIADVDHVAINQDDRANRLAKLHYLVRSRPSPGLILERFRNRQQRRSVVDQLNGLPGAGRFQGQFHRVEHHLAHLSSAFHVSPFREAVALSVDGFGDFASTAWGFGRGTDITIAQRVLFPHSLGIFYQAITQLLGFPNYGDEYKVMGLAPYGRPRFVQEIRQLVQSRSEGRFTLDLSFFRHHHESIATLDTNGAPVYDRLYSHQLEELLGPARRASEPLEQRHRDLAHSAQVVYEEVFLDILRAAHARFGGTQVVLAGGCANNSVANGKVRRATPFRQVYVHAAPGDAGGAIGAAFAVWHATGGARSFVMDHAYWGPAFTDADCLAAMDRRAREIEEAGCTVTHFADEGTLCDHTAAAIAAGQVVGWFQGHMEWGPRALGNRSILCDPRRGDIKDLLNAKIKRRESFRPFAPSVLADSAPEWFEEDDQVPFMMQVYQVRHERRSQIPAVTHVDGSGRLQTVTRAANPRYAALIEAFHRRTGVPMVLNTSFNENEPVVCTPDEALSCFLRTKMDVLVLENRVLARQKAPIGL
jgi:carbamoyltransferase